MAGIQRFRQGIGVHSGAAAHVYEDGAGLHHGQRLFVDDLLGRRRIGQAQGYEIRFGQQPGQVLQRTDFIHAVRLFANCSADGGNAAAQGFHPLCEVDPDIAQADDQRMVLGDAGGQFHPLPFMFLHVIAVDLEVPDKHDDRTDHVFRDGAAVSARGVGQQTALGFMEHFQLRIAVGTGGIQLHELHLRKIHQLVGIHAADQDVGPFQFFPGHALLGGPAIFAGVSAGGLEHFFFFFVNGKHTQYVVHDDLLFCRICVYLDYVL